MTMGFIYILVLISCWRLEEKKKAITRQLQVTTCGLRSLDASCPALSLLIKFNYLQLCLIVIGYMTKNETVKGYLGHPNEWTLIYP